MDQSWDQHQREIWTLYLVENKPLKAVMEEMEKRHGFFRPKQQWVDQLKSWGCVKNLNKDGWRYVGHQARKRRRSGLDTTVKEQGKPAYVVLAGVRLSSDQVEKGIRNHCPGPRLKAPRYRCQLNFDSLVAFVRREGFEGDVLSMEADKLRACL